MSHEKELANPNTDPQKITHAQAREDAEQLKRLDVTWSAVKRLASNLLAYISQQEAHQCLGSVTRSVRPPLELPDAEMSDGAHAERNDVSSPPDDTGSQEPDSRTAASSPQRSGTPKANTASIQSGSDLVPSLEERARQVEWFVIITTGDGAFTRLVPGGVLHQVVHDAVCACGASWNACNDGEGGTRRLVLSLDDEDAWTHEYPNRQRHIWCDHGEDYTLTVSHITEGVEYLSQLDARVLVREREERIQQLEAVLGVANQTAIIYLPNQAFARDTAADGEDGAR